MSKPMMIDSSTIEDKVLKSCQSLIAAFFPTRLVKISLAYEVEPLDIIFINKRETSKPEQLIFEFEIREGTNEPYHYKLDCSLDYQKYKEFVLPNKESLFDIMLKRAIYLSLTNFTGQDLPWGILTGIRPMKLIHLMEDLGYHRDEQAALMNKFYLLHPSKVDQLIRISSAQRPYINKFKQKREKIAVYLNIPFCPSRCTYCSFPSIVSNDKKEPISPVYLNTLLHEIKLTGLMMRKFRLIADSVYIGGGTPTILTSSQLKTLLEAVTEELTIDQNLEFTLEAGRPDTLNLEKYQIMENLGVNRLSINPQTMQDETLGKIGRIHNSKDIIEHYGIARRLSDWVINMDLILGLPDEGKDQMLDTLDQIIALRPDNLTVHSFAYKKGSNAWEDRLRGQNTISWSKLQTKVEEKIIAAHYHPYYLYRQKYSKGNLENIGYANGPKECRYNIAMIEEQQTVIGIGAGACSKIFNNAGKHNNLYHSTNINFYIDQYLEVHYNKERLLESYFENALFS